MSCCGDLCRCGPSCTCGSGCGCKLYSDMSDEKITSTQPMIHGVAPQEEKVEGVEMPAGCENGACKCGPHCTCNPCNCK